VPAVTVVTLNPPAVAVERVRPPPGLEIVFVSGYLMMTTPEPPEAPRPPGPLFPPPPPPPPVLVPPADAFAGEGDGPPLPPPPVPPVPAGPTLVDPPPPPARVTEVPVIEDAVPLPPFIPAVLCRPTHQRPTASAPELDASRSRHRHCLAMEMCLVCFHYQQHRCLNQHHLQTRRLNLL
jgi:hypothetical protein